MRVLWMCVLNVLGRLRVEFWGAGRGVALQLWMTGQGCKLWWGGGLTRRAEGARAKFGVGGCGKWKGEDAKQARGIEGPGGVCAGRVEGDRDRMAGWAVQEKSGDVI